MWSILENLIFIIGESLMTKMGLWAHWLQPVFFHFHWVCDQFAQVNFQWWLARPSQIEIGIFTGGSGSIRISTRLSLNRYFHQQKVGIYPFLIAAILVNGQYKCSCKYRFALWNVTSNLNYYCWSSWRMKILPNIRRRFQPSEYLTQPSMREWLVIKLSSQVILENP